MAVQHFSFSSKFFLSGLVFTNQIHELNNFANMIKGMLKQATNNDFGKAQNLVRIVDTTAFN